MATYSEGEDRPLSGTKVRARQECLTTAKRQQQTMSAACKPELQSGQWLRIVGATQAEPLAPRYAGSMLAGMGPSQAGVSIWHRISTRP